MDAYKLEREGKKILELLKEMEVATSGSTGDALNALFHTINKEVKFAIHDENKMNKKNAAKLRRTEFKESMDRAISQIHMNLVGIII